MWLPFPIEGEESALLKRSAFQRMAQLQQPEPESESGRRHLSSASLGKAGWQGSGLMSLATPNQESRVAKVVFFFFWKAQSSLAVALGKEAS